MEDKTLTVGNTNPEYIGNWYYHNEISEPEFYQITILELQVLENGKASYLQCEISNDSRGNSSMKKRYSIINEDARVIEISDGKITIEQQWEFLHLEKSLDVPSIPFTEGGIDYLYVEGYQLMRTNKPTKPFCPES
jgi:hypothetical protein